MQTELSLMGLPPAATTNAARAAEIAQEIINSSATFSRPGEPNNVIKINHVREQFNCPHCGLHDVFPYPIVFAGDDAAKHQAGSFLSDLRCQYILRLINEKLIPATLGWVLYMRNRIWYVRFREQLNLAMQAHARQQDGEEANA